MKISYINTTTLLTFLTIFSWGQTIYSLAGTGNIGNTGDGGQASMATFGFISDVAVDPSGNVYIADINNSRIRKIDNTGIISAFTASTGGFSGDGGPVGLAEISNAYAIATDAAGNLYIADSGNNRIRKVSSSGTITTIAGTGVSGFSGDGGQAILCQLNNPVGIAVDASSNIYIVDGGNNRVRKINPSGIITTIAGTGVQGYSGDGGLATNAQLNFGTSSLAFGGVDIDLAGNIYISDYGNSRIRKISTTNSITTIAGGGSITCSSNSVVATTMGPVGSVGVMVDASANIYVSTQFGCSYLKKIDGAGFINDIAGIGNAGTNGDGGLATLAELYDPWNSAIDASGNIYIVGNGYKVRVICPSGCLAGIKDIIATEIPINISPNPNNGKFKIHIPVPVQNSSIVIYNSIGQRVFEQINLEKNNMFDLENINSGLYNVVLLHNNQKISSKKIIIK